MFHGLFGVLVTPFDQNKQIDFESLDRLVNLYLQQRAHGLVILSVMGEGPYLTEVEQTQVLNAVIQQVQKQIPVLAGINHNNTPMAMESSQRCYEMGASGLLVAPPHPYDSIPETMLREHFQSIASVAPIPQVLLDYPPMTGTLSIPQLARLVNTVELIKAIKLEAEPTPDKIREVRLAGIDVQIFGALGGLHCLEELKAGCDGLMTGYAYPEHLLQILAQYRGNDIVKATQAYQEYSPLLQDEQQNGLIQRKKRLVERNIIATSVLRT